MQPDPQARKRAGAAHSIRSCAARHHEAGGVQFPGTVCAFHRIIDRIGQPEIIGREGDPWWSGQGQLQQEYRHPDQQQDDENHRTEGELRKAGPEALAVGEERLGGLGPHRWVCGVAVI